MENLDKNLETIEKGIEQTQNDVKSLSASVADVVKANEELAKEMAALKSVTIITEADREKALGAEKVKWFDSVRTKAINETTDGEGGYVVPEEWGNSLLEVGLKYGLTRQFAKPFTTKQKLLHLANATGFTAYIIAENTAITASTPTFNPVTFTPFKNAVLVQQSDEWTSDVTPAMVDSVIIDVAKALAKKEDHVAFTADGTADTNDGGKYGLLYNTSTEKVDMGGSSTSTKMSISDLTFVDVSNMMSAIDEYDIDNGVFIMSPTMRSKLFALQAAETGVTPIFDAVNSTLFGVPIRWSNIMPAYTTADSVSTPYILYGDFQYLGICDRQLTTIEMNASVGFTSASQYLRGLERVDVQALAAKGWCRLITAAS